ncbi:phage tail spike protein [Staphylococcus cohnii]|uniref:phage tail spike protein n=1 Tax=Staphylococcus cohnii TaxID=29382 RepID=UPI0025515F77|nr:phage tail spike protein [Staphylococcus cohnii]WIL68754.1 phage tail spike protein [Staphylococcus cohnii]WIL68915.1 phage tail spike protein [Staphylococcus cohnii]
MFIRDLDGEEYFLQGVVNHEQELNGDERIDIEIEYTDMNSEFLSKQDDLKMWIILFEGKEYRIISSKQTGFGDKYRISVTAVLYMLDWLNSHRVYERIDASLTVTEAFNIVFNDTPFTYSTVNSSPSNRFEGIGEGETRLEIFKTFIDRYGYEFKIVGNVVYLYNQIGNDANFEYRYKVNTQNIEKEVDASEMWTYARGYGNYSDDDSDTDVVEKAKLKREYTSPLAKIIGIREAPPIRDGRVTITSTMDESLKKLVEESVKISFTADIYDMSQQGYDYQHAVLGDRVFLVDERIGLDTEIRVVKITRNFSSTGQILDLEITFGSSNMADQYGSNLSTAAKDIADLIQGRKSLPFQALDIISKSMVTKIQNTSSELMFDDLGIHAIDKKNANNIVTMNSSGWMLSTDGGKTAKTALTAEGIVADTITSGSLDTSLVRVHGRDLDEFTEMTGGKIRSTGEFTRTFPQGDAVYKAYTESWNGVYRSGLINKKAGGKTLTNITRWLSLTDKEITTQREVHSASPDKKGARFIDFFADEEYTSDVYGQGMHIYSGQNLTVESKYRLTLNSSDGWNTRLTNSALEIEKDGMGLALRRQTAFGSTSGSGGQYISIQSYDGNEHGHVGIISNNRHLSVQSQFGDVHLRGNAIRALNSEGSSLQDIYASTFDLSGVGRIAFDGGDTYLQGQTGVRFTKYKSGEFVSAQAKDFIKSSSRELKTNIKELEDGMQAIRRLTPVSFDYKDDLKNGITTGDIGFIAEDSPDISVLDHKAVSVQKIATWAILGLKEQDKKIAELESKLEGLTNE